MSLPRVIAITGRIISQFLHDHRSLALVFIVPIFVMSILGYVFRAQESSTVRVALVNEDQAVRQNQFIDAVVEVRVSDYIIQDLKSNNSLEITEMTRSTAEKAVRDGTERAALVFPASFTQDLVNQRKAPVQIIVEGSNPSEASGALAAVGQAVQRSSASVFTQFRFIVPALASSSLPQGPPVEVTTTRLYGSADLKMLDYFAPMFIAYIGFFLIFLLTSVSFLRERTQGTMERLAASPVTRLELVLGYMFGFGFFSMVQAAVLVLFTVYVLQVKYAGNLLSVFVVTLALVLGAVNLGILMSAFSKNELQAIQFIPLVILPQVFLSGLLWPIQQMPEWLQVFARLMPLSYAIDALTSIMVRGQALSSTWLDLVVLLGFATVIAVLGAVSVRREIA